MDKLASTIIHWNCNGLKTRHQNGEIRRLVSQYSPLALCLQHTNHILASFDEYQLAAHYPPNEKELGTAIYTHKSISYQKVKNNKLNVQTCMIDLNIDKKHIYNPMQYVQSAQL